MARVGEWYAYDPDVVTHDVDALARGGRWVALLPFNAEPVFVRFTGWERSVRPGYLGAWSGIPVDSWRSSMTREEYMHAVHVTREAIARGDLYQANICRVMSAPDDDTGDVMALDQLLMVGNPAPHSGALRLPEAGIELASASPELFLSRSGQVITTKPIKGTAPRAGGLTDKDAAENVMIVDLMRNDLSHFAIPGSVIVDSLLQVESHPGLVQLVSTVSCSVDQQTRWPEILLGTFPPGSVTGAPKIAALDLISELEPSDRELYCGAFGIIDSDAHTASLAVTIRTFWKSGGSVKFGTGAGITWGSVPEREWSETVLKATNLTRVASQSWRPS